ncbi:citrate lyase beta subunit [Kitasatospora sp. MAA4]|uniref:HpcH/HpaI aldolase/citrate lyase family protein n=1 Tax=Kitasatospora sp. MAA4 TaxID=3035093 RepID=UPI0024768907|nr:HpcH/HpaI aldolase/citrate lyase family protein [Kitasatospora sp. MAA4]MDH6131797.1 citrate lyase beta subunit [Kitasatospora sp. MAA4]
MRHFGHLGKEIRRRLFLTEPGSFDRNSAADTLSTALGATLYSPATRPTLADDIRRQAARGVVSMVLCLEDAIRDEEVEAAEHNLVEQLRGLSDSAALPLPLLFVRVRAPRQIADLVRRLGPAAGLLSGFVLPKFTEDSGGEYLEELTAAEAACGRRLFAMPVLESPELAHLETRREQLFGTAALLAKYRERILAVRLGVTDLCAAYGLRRSADLTAYDVALVAAVIGDVVNVLGRADGTGYTVTGPVWEYFPVQERMFKPQLRRTPFSSASPPRDEVRRRLIEHDLDGLIREVELDRANGLLGKTCIHPSHVPAVHALSVVTHEEFCDAGDILRPERAGGGVLRSAYTNKMNEAKPHRAWAERVMRRAEVFGVAREDVTFADLLSAGVCG